MNTPNFGSVLDRPSASVERPKPLPVGDYIWQVQGQPRFDKSSQKKTEFAEYTLVPLAAIEGSVDMEALDTALTNAATGEKKALSAKTMKATFYLTEDALWRLTEFLEACEVEDGEGISLRSRVMGAPGCQVVGTIRHRPNNDGTAFFAEFGGFAKVSALQQAAA